MCWPEGVLQISVDGDDRTEAKIKTQKNPIFGGFQTKPQKRPGPKIELTSKKSHAEFSSLKAVAFGCTLFDRTTRLGYTSTTKNLQSVLNTPKNQATQKNTCQSFQPQKNPESKSSNPKNSLHHLRQLKSGVPPPPPPPLSLDATLYLAILLFKLGGYLLSLFAGTCSKNRYYSIFITACY